MVKLISQNCNSLPADLAVLDTTKVTAFLKELKDLWQLQPDESSIKRRFSFNNYYETMTFVNATADIAHQQDHHPDMLVGYNYCCVIFTTHSANGLSIKDFICAAKVDEIIA